MPVNHQKFANRIRSGAGGKARNKTMARTNIDLDLSTMAEIIELAKIENVSVAQKVRELLELALITLEEETC